MRPAGLRTSIQTQQMPGGRSALGAVGGLGAFMYGDEDDDPAPQEEPVPRHQRMQVPQGPCLSAFTWVATCSRCRGACRHDGGVVHSARYGGVLPGAKHCMVEWRLMVGEASPGC